MAKPAVILVGGDKGGVGKIPPILEPHTLLPNLTRRPDDHTPGSSKQQEEIQGLQSSHSPLVTLSCPRQGGGHVIDVSTSLTRRRVVEAPGWPTPR